MKKTTMAALIIAGVCLFLGAAFAGIGFLLTDDLKPWQPTGFDAAGYDIAEPFDNVTVHTEDFDVTVLASADGKCHVEVRDEGSGFGLQPAEHQVSVVDGTLHIRQTEKPFRFGLFWGEREITLWLPEQGCDTLSVKTASGDVSVPSGELRFQNASMTSTSGDLAFTGSVESHLTVSTTSGDATVNALAQNVNAESTSGDVELHCTATYVAAKTTSGDVKLTSVGCDDLQVTSTSGDVEFSDLRALQTNIHTVSGEVKGSLKTTKFFDVKTVSGSVNVPHSEGADGDFKVETTSGDVSIWLA